MKAIGFDEIDKLKYAKQYFQDCYLVSSVSALANCSNGRRILAENIAHTPEGFRIKFKNINGKEEDFFVSQKEIDNLVYMDKYLNPLPIDNRFPHNPIIKAIEVAMNKLLGKYPAKKPWICHLPSCNEKFEFNQPSNFLEMFTGQKPLSLNEKSFRLNLMSKKEESKTLFANITQNPDSTFIAGTLLPFDKRLSDVHCYNIKEVNSDNSISLFDHRLQQTIKLSFEEAIKKLKYIVGYFNKDLSV